MIEFTETPEQREVRLSVRAFHFAKYRDGAPAIAVPPLTTGPGAMGPTPDGLDVTPAPSSSCKRYKEPHACLSCPAVIPAHWKRCRECAKENSRQYQRKSKVEFRKKRKAERAGVEA